jgi:hypothetical protein
MCAVLDMFVRVSVLEPGMGCLISKENPGLSDQMEGEWRN